MCNPGQSSLDINTVETVHCVILIPVYEQYGVADSKFSDSGCVITVLSSII